MNDSLSLAKQACAAGEFCRAKQYARMAADEYRGSSMPLACLDALTLLQSIYVQLRDIRGHEALREEILSAFYTAWPDSDGQCLALLYLDWAAFYARVHESGQARACFTKAAKCFNPMTPEELSIAECLLCFSEAVLHCHAENYMACIRVCQESSARWNEIVKLPPLSHPFYGPLLEQLKSGEQYQLHNLIYLSSAFGKTGNPEEGIWILEDLSHMEGLSDNGRMYIHVNLAELYARAGRFQDSDRLIAPFPDISYEDYPDLAACLDTIRMAKGLHTGDLAITAGRLKRLSDYCHEISPDILRIHCFDMALALAQRGCFREALASVCGNSLTEYTLRMALYRELHMTAKIRSLFPSAASCYFREIDRILNNYEEQTVCRYLEILEYEAELLMGAALDIVDHSELYDFLLNIKGISYEAAWRLSPLERDRWACLRLADQKVSVRELQSCLPTDTLLMEYTAVRFLSQPDSCLVFLTGHDTVRPVLLSSCARVDQAVDRWRKAMEERDDPEEATRYLKRLLVLPVRRETEGRTQLIAAPYGSLYGLAFDQLFSSETTDVRYVNVGRELCFRKTADGTDTDGLLCSASLLLGAPSYAALPGLPYARTELKIAGEFTGAVPVTGEQATAQTFLSACEEAKLIHLAVHGFSRTEGADRDRMENSVLAFSGDTFLSARRISQMDLHQTRLCVLSACYSGMGGSYGCEGQFGLRRAFALAGCRRLLVCLWSVNDLSAALFMLEFYSSLQKGRSVSQALKESKATLQRRNTAKWRHICRDQVPDICEVLKGQSEDYIPFSHPYYWAGYIIV